MEYTYWLQGRIEHLVQREKSYISNLLRLSFCLSKIFFSRQYMPIKIIIENIVSILLEYILFYFHYLINTITIATSTATSCYHIFTSPILPQVWYCGHIYNEILRVTGLFLGQLGYSRLRGHDNMIEHKIPFLRHDWADLSEYQGIWKYKRKPTWMSIKNSMMLQF